MKKISTVLILMLMLAFFASDAGAMIGGELDMEHTNVGAIVFEWPAYGDILARACTATLIHPHALVTAAHCTEYLIDGGVVPEKVWITFEENALIGTPRDDPDNKFLEIYRIINHPDYSKGRGDNDIALIILVEPVLDRDLVDLPAEGYMDNLLQALPPGKAERDLDLIFVGYGASAYKELPDIHLDAVRRIGTVSFVNLLPLEILTNNSNPEDAVVCDGDSGGPVFHVVDQENEILVGLQARSGSSLISCDGLGPEYKTRLDTSEVQNWIDETIDGNLPEPLQ